MWSPRLSSGRKELQVRFSRQSMLPGPDPGGIIINASCSTQRQLCRSHALPLVLQELRSLSLRRGSSFPWSRALAQASPRPPSEAVPCVWKAMVAAPE